LCNKALPRPLWRRLMVARISRGRWGSCWMIIPTTRQAYWKYTYEYTGVVWVVLTVWVPWQVVGRNDSGYSMSRTKCPGGGAPAGGRCSGGWEGGMTLDTVWVVHTAGWGRPDGWRGVMTLSTQWVVLTVRVEVLRRVVGRNIQEDNGTGEADNRLVQERKVERRHSKIKPKLSECNNKYSDTL